MSDLSNQDSKQKTENAPLSEGPTTTVVGGRPPSPGQGQVTIPRGIDVLVKKASVDPEFRDKLLTERAEAAIEIDLKLSAAEKAMLNTVPEVTLSRSLTTPLCRMSTVGYFSGRWEQPWWLYSGSGYRAVTVCGA
jgi:hypothetical protein